MSDERPLMIGLIRVSTEKQADSGLGLAGQARDIEEYRARTGGELLETYQEVESGKHNDIDKRPRLKAAAAHALEVDGVLVFAKFDRLVRSTSVMQYLKDTKVRFVACDNPHANEFTVDILVAVAAQEARSISDRTKRALRAYRDEGRISRRIRAMYPDGVPPDVALATAGKLGGSLPQCSTLSPEARARGTARSIATRRARAAKSAAAVAELIAGWRAVDPGLTLRAIAAKLNARRRKTPAGKAWGPQAVKRVLDRPIA